MNEKFRRIEANFLQFGRVKTKTERVRPVTSDEENEVAILALFEAYPRASTKDASAVLRITNSSIHTMLKSISGTTINLRL